MSSIQPTYYLRNNGWFTSSLESVTKEAFKAHQAEKYSTLFSPSKTIYAVVMGILAMTQLARSNMRGPSLGTQLVLPALGLHLWSCILPACAQTSTPSFTPVPGPQGDEFQVNNYTILNQGHPDVISLKGGGFFVTWYSLDQDGSDSGVYGQRFNKAGMKIGSEFQINTNSTGNQFLPRAASLEGGGFIVVWQSDGQDGSGYGIYGQRFDAAGVKGGTEFQINTYTMSNQEAPSVAPLKGGGFVVTWQSDGQNGSSDEIYGQRFDGTGAKVGSEFQINTYITDNQSLPSAASLEGGGFVIVWNSFGQDGSANGIYGQRFDETGAKLGSEFQANNYTSSYQEVPSITPLEEGGFVVTWASYGQDGMAHGVFGQRFDGAGAKVGSEFQVNTYTTDEQIYPRVASLKGGGFVVTWMSNGQDGSSYGIYGQRFDRAGAKVGSEFQVNTYTTNSQDYQSVAALEEGGFVVTWQSVDQDGLGIGVYGQLFDAAGAKVGIATTTNILGQTAFSGSGNLTSSRVTAKNQTVENSTRKTLSLSVIETKPVASTSDSNIPLIAGLTAAGGALVCSLLGGIVFYMRQKSKNNASESGVELGQHPSVHDAGASEQNYVELPPEQPANKEGDHYLSISARMKKLAETPQESSYIGVDSLEST